ncbi:MAG: hypothetical protein Q9191_007347 [Dirinaria sp. TL-2023a]
MGGVAPVICDYVAQWLASCFPGKWSCDPSTCATANFSLPNGDVVARDSDPSPSATSCSPSVGTETVFVTPPALASVAATGQEKPCTSKAKRTADMAIVGISVGMPLAIVALVAWVMVLKERAQSRRTRDEKEQMERELLKAQTGNEERLRRRYEMRSGTKSPAIVEWYEKSAGPFSVGRNELDHGADGRDRQRHEMRSNSISPVIVERYEKSASPVPKRQR